MSTNKTFGIEHVDLPPDPERVMEGLRDTGYTFNTAMADIIDNSISAHATKVDIQDSNRSKHEHYCLYC